MTKTRAILSVFLTALMISGLAFVGSVHFGTAQSGAPTSTPTPTSPIAYWKLDEASGNIAYDSSGNNNDGTINGATWVTDVNGSGCSLNFNGVDNSVSIPFKLSSSPSSLTVSAWINSNFSSSTGTILYNGQGGEFSLFSGNASGMPPNDIAGFNVKLTDGNWYLVFSSALAPNTWYNIVGTWVEGSSLKIYIDGTLSGQNTAIPDLPLRDAGAGFPSFIGTYLNSMFFFNGDIADVKIYDYAQTPSQIAQDIASVNNTASSPTPTSSTTNTWTNLMPSVSPPARANQMMCYDSTDNVLVMFGGWDGAYLGDTWIYSFQNNMWINKSPQGSPSPRERSGMVYDSKDDLVILFGGYNGQNFLDETWTYNVKTNTWTQMFPAVSPPNNSQIYANGSMINLGMAYDSKDNVVIVFSDEGNTWAYNLAANIWVNMKPSVSPAPRALSTNGQQMVYDESNNDILLFGGSPIWYSTALNDTWAYNYEANTWTNLNPSIAPSAREDSQMVYDSVDNVIALYGGGSGDQSQLFDDTWVFNMTSNKWTDVTPAQSPPVRYASAMAYNPTNNEAVLFGGFNNQQEIWYGDTWAFTFAPNSTPVPSPTPPPTPTLPTPSLAVSCQSSTSYSNFRVNISGSLTVDGAGISGVPVLLSYSVNEGNSWIGLTTVGTDSNGNFDVVWFPSASGIYLLNAQWAGNSTFSDTNTTINFAIVPCQGQSVFSLSSNSTISAFAFNSTSEELSFIVSGASGTHGYVDLYIPKSLMSDVSALKVYLDDKQLNCSIESQGDSWLLSFNYHLCTHQVVVDFGTPRTTAASTLFSQSQIGDLVIGVAVVAMVIVAVAIGAFLLGKRAGRK